ncbi:hypothetical protein ZYGR_0E00520 [Zygosaccharomyces rouxii]|uniref:ZYRO0B01232p n=2 Tax=Zygosaccharomyces rouxii TaxID=4956 RepID=C5DQL2_ZYGRC|nr:uncharacterized protein ZYRO0B01232g [Zygosaccharomyces rouxii]KAH9200375.1 hypothetical protein LQ764DRAFT_227497 [Zygosaccharomyces rouxii]GAV47041.1 hypothetical protein ZYGR_0E00520 [Zygosaccharomyces rouxii]CAR26073.1 ZYRO0B01232p [Zygosaccharomyces rouxii]
MKLQSLVEDLLQEDENYQRRSKALIFVLGDEARLYIERDLSASPGRLSSVNAIIRSRRDVEVLFLNRLQYLFMYLMKWEAEDVGYNRLVLYGLDELIFLNRDDSENLTNSQLRLANLVFSAAFRIKRKHCLKDVSVINLRDHVRLKQIEDYWRHVC